MIASSSLTEPAAVSAAAGFPYRRYHIDAQPVPDAVPLPPRFRVHVCKHRLAWLIVKELFHYRGRTDVVLSRPCVYGVFSGPVGGFAPREELCVGCLRCTVQYPEIVQIRRNPERAALGDSYFTPEHVDTVVYEARTGNIPVRGAGYRGSFGGAGWDGMWTDMSEIVRPTRDGIHGREFISTAVDVGTRPPFLEFDAGASPLGPLPRTVSLPIPFLLDGPPRTALSEKLAAILAQAARETGTLAILPSGALSRLELAGPEIVPLLAPGQLREVDELRLEPALVELGAWDAALLAAVRAHVPDAIVCVRMRFAPGLRESLLRAMDAGVGVFHLVADYHGRGADGRFVLEWIREIHDALVQLGRREEVTLLGSGGIVAAEHGPKAIICGLDAVALDTPVLVALQARMRGECVDAETSRFELPELDAAWGVQRLKNLLAAWRDQLLEVLGAMGLREVRRLRGEIGRAMFQGELEGEAFQEIAGYGDGR